MIIIIWSILVLFKKRQPMKKLSRTTVARIEKLRRSGYSYKEISKITGLSVGTIYSYTHLLSVSQVGIDRLRSLQEVTHSKFVNKFGQSKPIQVLHTDITREKARIVGHCLFDGFVSKYVVSYTSASKDLTEQFVDDMAKEYSILPSLKKIEGKYVPYYSTYACSKIVCDDIRRFVLNCDIRSKQMLTPETISKDDEIVAEIVRAFWEDEGSISYEGNLIGEIKNQSLRGQLIELHQRLGVEVTPYRDRTYGCYGIYVKRERGNLKGFCEKIGFRYGIITTGKLAGLKKLDALIKHYRGIGGPAGI